VVPASEASYPYDASLSSCPSHGRELRYFCLEHRALLCLECLAFTHVGHQFVALEEALGPLTLGVAPQGNEGGLEVVCSAVARTGAKAALYK
jgi:hypothetical protein